MEPRLHDVETEAARLSTTPRHLRELIRKGMPHIKLGGLIRFDPDDVDAWLATRRAERQAS
jgi:excisionase family DNA binding protein